MKKTGAPKIAYSAVSNIAVLSKQTFLPFSMDKRLHTLYVRKHKKVFSDHMKLKKKKLNW